MRLKKASITQRMYDICAFAVVRADVKRTLEIADGLVKGGLPCMEISFTNNDAADCIKAVKEKYGDRLSFWGGISTQREMRLCTPDELTDVIRETVRVMSRGGGYIAAPTHAIPQDVPPENVAAMMAFFEKM